VTTGSRQQALWSLFFSLYKGLVLKACKNAYFFLFKVDMLILSTQRRKKTMDDLNSRKI
jgi:hypothetical protein